MLPNLSRGMRTVGLIAVGLLLSACQVYEPRPLDLQSHRNEWRDRLANEAAVATFVNDLQTRNHTGLARFDLSDGLSLPEAELVAMVFNPDLRLARLRAGFAEASAEHTGRWDDPNLSIDLLRITENVSNPWIITPGLSVTLPISGRLAAQKQQADAAARVELTRVAETEWAARHELRVAWWAWSANLLRLEETRRVLDTLASLVDATSRLAEAGEMPRPEAALFGIEQARLRQAVRGLEAEQVGSEHRLRAMMGLSPNAPLKLEPARPTIRLPDDPSADLVASRNLTLARLEEAYEVAEQTLLLEIRKQYPDLTIGPQYESDQGQSRIGLIAGVPIPLFNANRQGIVEARVERELARAEYETTYERLANTLAMSLDRVTAVQDQRDALERVFVPMVDQQLLDARKTLDLGEGGGLVLLESLVRTHEAKLDLIDIWLSEAEAVLEVHRLLGPEPPPHHAEQPATEIKQEVQP